MNLYNNQIKSSLLVCQRQTRQQYAKIYFVITIILCLVLITSPSFAKSKLKTKLSNFFQKIEKKIDEKTSNTENKSSDVKPQIATAPVIVASTTKKLTLEDFGLLPQNEVKIKLLFTQKIINNFDTDNFKFDGCQGFTTDGKYFYVGILSNNKEIEKHTKILKIRIDDFKIVKEKDLGTIGHSNSLTYNPKTQKIYTAPLWKNWKTIYEFDTDLNNLKKVSLYNNNGLVIIGKEFRSVTYLLDEDKYIVVTDNTSLVYFDSNFKIIKTFKTSMPLRVTTTQALSYDGINLFSVTNLFAGKPFVPKENYIFVYDLNGNYIDKYVFSKEFGNKYELEQITFCGGQCYGLSGHNGIFRIYEITLRKNKNLLINSY